MTISINPQQDTLFIPVELYKDFMEYLVKVYTYEKLKDEVRIEERKIPSVIQKINELNEEAKNLNNNLPDVIFHKGWNRKFNSEKESGSRLFHFLEKYEIGSLEARIRQEYKNRQALFANIANAAKAAVDEVDYALRAYTVLNEATDVANNAATPPVTENINKSLTLTKKLYESGFIDRSEYLAALVKTKKLLEVVVTDAATAKARQDFGILIANTCNKDSKIKGYMENLGILQTQATNLSQGKHISENRKKLIKSLIKKRILEETIKQENKKEYLNEFFLLAGLLAAAAAIGGWIGKKFSQYFYRGPAVDYSPDSRNRRSYNDYDEEDMADLFNRGGTDPATGQIIKKDGLRPMNPEHTKKGLQTYITYINEISTLYTENLQKLEMLLPSCNYDEANKMAIQNALNSIPKTLEKGKEVIPYLNDYINS